MGTVAVPTTLSGPRTRARDEVAVDPGLWPRTSRLLPWTLALFLVMVWLVPFDAVVLPIPMPLDARLDRPMLLALLGVWVLSMAVTAAAYRPRVYLSRVHAAVGVFVTLAIVGALLNVDVLVNLDEFQLVLKKLALLISFGLFFVVVASSIRPEEVPRFIVFALGLACVAAIGTVYEYRVKHDIFFDLVSHIPGATVHVPTDLDQPDSIGRQTVYSSTGHPLEIATMLGMMVPFALVGVVRAEERRQRIIYGLVCGLLVGGALATYRKTSIVAPTAGILVLLAYRPRIMLRKLAPLAGVLFVMVHVLAPGATGSVFASLNPSTTAKTNTTADRANDYQATWPDISSHLALGRGYGGYDPHKYRILDNEYLGLVITTGFLGLASWLGVLIATMALAHRVIRSGDTLRAPPALAASASVAVLGMALALFDGLGFPHIPYLFFFIAGLVVVLSRRTPAEVGHRVEPARHIPSPRTVTRRTMTVPAAPVITTPVDVVVVSYNSRDTLRACVAPLAGVAGVTVFAVDNASPDGALEAIADLDVEAIQTGRNGGFAFGCNIGLRRGRAPYVLFLNPDAWVDVEDLARMVAVLDAEPSVGLVGPRLLDADGALIPSQRRMPSAANAWGQALFAHRLAPGARWSGEIVQDPAAYDGRADADWLSGAAMLARREVLERIGGLDEGFFLYSEDADLCARIREQGYAIRYDPSATVRHHGGHSAPRSSLLPVLATSRARFARKHASRASAWSQRVALVVHAMTHAFTAAVRRPAVARGHAASLRALVSRSTGSRG